MLFLYLQSSARSSVASPFYSSSLHIMNSRFTTSFSFSISFSSSSFFFLIFVQLSITEVAPSYLFSHCPNTTLFTPNSTYQSNLNTLLSSLSASAANSTNGFANATAGHTSPDWAYGLFLCRGDVNTSTCSNCVATGKQDILQRCPNQRASTIWYDDCMLRYANRSIFSTVEQEPIVFMQNIANISDPSRFSKVLGQAVDDILTRASDDKSGKKVAVNETDFTSLQKLYTLAQCTPDLTALDCYACLRFAIGYLPQGRQGGRTFTPSCSVRFELYPFYDASAMVTSAPPPSQIPSPPPPLPPVTKPKGTPLFFLYRRNIFCINELFQVTCSDLKFEKENLGASITQQVLLLDSSNPSVALFLNKNEVLSMFHTHR